MSNKLIIPRHHHHRIQLYHPYNADTEALTRILPTVSGACMRKSTSIVFITRPSGNLLEFEF